MANALKQFGACLDRHRVPYQEDESGRFISAYFKGQSPDLLHLVALNDPGAIVMVIEDLASTSADEASTLLTFACHLPGLNLSRNPGDGSVEARCLLWYGPEGLGEQTIRAALESLLSAADKTRQALELTRAGSAPETALDQVRANIVLAEGNNPVLKLSAGVDPLFSAFLKADDREKHLREHLDEFSDDVLLELTRFSEQAARARETFACDQTEALITAILIMRTERDIRDRTRPVAELLAAESIETVSSIADARPEILERNLSILIAGAARTALNRSTVEDVFHLAKIHFWLQQLRRKRPVITAVLDLTGTGPWEEQRELTRDTPELQSPEAAKAAHDLAACALARGDRLLGVRYAALAQRLDCWQDKRFVLENEGSQAPSLIPSAIFETMLLNGEMLSAPKSLADFIRTNRSCFTPPAMEHFGCTLRQKPPEVGSYVYRILNEVETAHVESEQAALPEQLRNLLMVSSEDGLPRVRSAFLAVLSQLDRNLMPHLWAAMHIKLGIVCQELYLLKGDPADAKQAEDAFKVALASYASEWQLPHRGMAYHALGALFVAQFDLTEHEESSRTAAGYLHRALELRQPDLCPIDWAGTRAELGNLFYRRYQHTKQEADAIAALEHYGEAQKKFEQEGMTHDSAKLQYALGNLLVKTDSGTAEQHLHKALTEFEREKDQQGAALAHQSLSTLLTSRYQADKRLEDSVAAVEHLRQHAEVYTSSTHLMDWAGNQYNLGNLLALRYAQTGSEEDFQRAEKCFKGVFDRISSEAVPARFVPLALALGRLYSAAERWEDAEKAYANALAAAKIQHYAAATDEERRSFMGEHVAISSERAFCLLRLGDPIAALAELDRGRAHLLGQALGFEQQLCLHDDHAVCEWRELRRAYRNAESHVRVADLDVTRARTPTETMQSQATQDKARKRLREAVEALSSFEHKWQLEPAIITVDDLSRMELPSGTAVMSLLITPKQAAAVCLCEGVVQEVALPDFTLTKIHELFGRGLPLAHKWLAAQNAATRALERTLAADTENFESETERLHAAFESRKQTLDEIVEFGGTYELGWLLSYQITFDLSTQYDRSDAVEAAMAGWSKTLADTLVEVSNRLWAPVSAALSPSVKRVILVSAGLASLLPMHAAAPDGIYVSYAPSISVWRHCTDRNVGGTDFSTVLATPAPDLPYSAAAGVWLQELCSQRGWQLTWLDGCQARTDAVLDSVRGRSIIHFSGHAQYDWQNALKATLHCSDGPVDLATIRKRMDLGSARLVVLSACESAISDVFSDEEFVGLPAALLEAGVPTVIASLWPVHDLSSAFLIDRFYELWTEQPDAATALRSATEWLRGVPKEELLPRIAQSKLSDEDKTKAYDLLQKDHPFESAFHWAAFAVYGAGFESPRVAAPKKVIGLNPEHSDAHYDLGLSLAQQERFKEAETAFQKVVLLNPVHSDAHYHLGLSLAQQERFKEAEQAFQEVIQLSPNHSYAHYHLGRSLRLQDRFKEAETAFRIALRLGVFHADVLIDLGISLGEQNRFKEAEAAFQKALRLSPEDPLIYNNLGLALGKQGRFKQAEAAFRKAVQIMPQDTGMHYNLAVSLAKQGRFKEAELGFQKAVQIRSQNVETHDTHVDSNKS